MGKALRGTSAAPTAIGAAAAPSQPATTCPTVTILPDTESLVIADKAPTASDTGPMTAALGAGTIAMSNAGPNQADRVRWQAAIMKTARECTPAGGKTGVKVGIAGRAVLGLRGKPGPVTLPIRVAVREGDKTTYSKLHKVQVTLTDAAPSAPFAIVDDTVTLSDPASATIYVGFDEKAR